MRKNAKRLAALAMSGVMTLSVAPVAVHADDKVCLLYTSDAADD